VLKKNHRKKTRSTEFVPASRSDPTRTQIRQIRDPLEPAGLARARQKKLKKIRARSDLF
jgi:hypothetical protein